MKKNAPTIAILLKARGCVTGRCGWNHPGDRGDMLPAAHGFDRFFGSLDHLNAEEEPENPDYPEDPTFRNRLDPRGVIQGFADGRTGRPANSSTGPTTARWQPCATTSGRSPSCNRSTRA